MDAGASLLLSAAVKVLFIPACSSSWHASWLWANIPRPKARKIIPLIETTTFSGVKSGLYEEVPAFTVLTEESWAFMDRKCTVRGLFSSDMLKNGNRVGGGEGARSPAPRCVCMYGRFWRASRISPYKGFKLQPWQGHFYYFTSRVVLQPLKLLFMWPRALGSTLSSLLNSNKDKSKLWRAAPGPDSSPSS